LLRWLGLGLLGLMALLVATGTATYMLLDQLDLAPFASHRASVALGRNVSIGSLHVTPGRWIMVELRAARLDNLPGGTRPLMAEVASVVAEIDARSLLHGPLLVRRLVVDGLDVLLERTADKTPNWKFGSNSQAQPQGSAGRAWFPVLLDAKFAGDVTFRTAVGAEFRTHLDNAGLLTEGVDSPVHLVGNGKYNGVAIGVEADLAPIAALRDASKPYDTDLRFKSGQTNLQFQGAMTDPLNLDGARGKIVLDAPTPGAIYRIAGISSDVAPSLQLVGAFVHIGPLWHLADGSGMLADGTILSADLQLDEGARGTPDRLSAAFAFDVLDLDALLGDRKRGGGHDADLSLAVSHAPDPLAEAKLSAKSLIYSKLSFGEFTLAASLKPSQIAVNALSLDYLGATVHASGRVDALSDGGRVSAEADMSNMDVQALRRALGLGPVPLLGHMEGRIEVAAEGVTLNEAAHDSRVSAVVAMSGGSISREAVELISTNPLALLRPAGGVSPVSCLLGAVDMRAGVGSVSSLRVRAEGGTIAAHGQFDLFKHRLDITVSSNPKTTSSLALDVPVRVSGSFADPAVRPAEWTPAGRAEAAAGDDVSRLLPNLQTFARQSPCLGEHGMR
jgi:uncharacterized protein involved in outer membrane biogenesis